MAHLDYIYLRDIAKHWQTLAAHAFYDADLFRALGLIDTACMYQREAHTFSLMAQRALFQLISDGRKPA